MRPSSSAARSPPTSRACARRWALSTGDRLASPGVWEGQAANQFKDEWTDTRRWAHTSVERLTELQDTVARVNQNITEAGGGR